MVKLCQFSLDPGSLPGLINRVDFCKYFKKVALSFLNISFPPVQRPTFLLTRIISCFRPTDTVECFVDLTTSFTNMAASNIAQDSQGRHFYKSYSKYLLFTNLQMQTKFLEKNYPQHMQFKIWNEKKYFQFYTKTLDHKSCIKINFNIISFENVFLLERKDQKTVYGTSTFH